MDLGPNVASKNKLGGAGVDECTGKGQIFSLAFCVGFSGFRVGFWAPRSASKYGQNMQRQCSAFL